MPNGVRNLLQTFLTVIKVQLLLDQQDTTLEHIQNNISLTLTFVDGGAKCLPKV